MITGATHTRRWRDFVKSGGGVCEEDSLRNESSWHFTLDGGLQGKFF